MIYFRFGGFCVYIDQIKLARFGRGKRGIFINFQNGDFFKGRLFTIVIFIRGKNKLLILFEIQHFPCAGSNRFITIGICVCMSRYNTDFS